MLHATLNRYLGLSIVRHVRGVSPVMTIIAHGLGIVLERRIGVHFIGF